MERAEFVQGLTLWFVVLIFLQTGSGDASHPLLTVVGIVAVVLSYAIPLALVAGVVLEATGD